MMDVAVDVRIIPLEFIRMNRYVGTYKPTTIQIEVKRTTYGDLTNSSGSQHIFDHLLIIVIAWCEKYIGVTVGLDQIDCFPWTGHGDITQDVEFIVRVELVETGNDPPVVILDCISEYKNLSNASASDITHSAAMSWLIS